MNVDLHSHSYYSDGTLSPTEVVQLAAKNNVDLLALTDHDSTHGITEARKEADLHGIQLIDGIEFSATWHDPTNKLQTLHIVGLNIDRNCLALRQCIANNQAERQQRATATIESLFNNNIDISTEIHTQVPEHGLITRTHIARALIASGTVKNYDQAFKKYLGKGKQAFIEGQWQSLKTVTSSIVEAGGVAVIAHPMRYRLNATRLSLLVEEFADIGGAAIEVITATQDINQQARAAQLAKQNNLYASIGSDFHSLDQPWAMLGRCNKLPKDMTPVWEAFL